MILFVVPTSFEDFWARSSFSGVLCWSLGFLFGIFMFLDVFVWFLVVFQGVLVVLDRCNFFSFRW